jgi:hypothetical protein
MWSFGDPHESKTDDPRFDSETAAIDAAVKASNEIDGEPVIAVWRDDDGECTTPVWAGWVYSAV